ncbi:probable maleylacetoacetate isomerase 1 [Drosophila pseudoobscura]|uniref:maleylacetoacetate isomerase n=1 Tax=Drosophila pseudoobscura pseudoobscura TaxID=46245 RepID=A0A6I8UMM1_DROPS|nr:probable maleylacetoacetate isomerase 1 [Drosophila pseudoobscura]
MTALRLLAPKGWQRVQFFRPPLSASMASSSVPKMETTVADEPRPILYATWLSSCSWRVRIALTLKQIPYDIQATSLLQVGEHHAYTDKYREVNPMQTVPSLQIDGHSLCDSVAIMHYLEETRPKIPLLPQDVMKRAKVREIVELICSAIQPLQNRLVLEHVGKEKSLVWAQHWIGRGFQGLDRVLAGSAGKYCVGDELSMADVCLVPQVFNARMYKVDLSPYPNIVRLDHELQSLPAFKSSHPHQQPDCPPKFAGK